MVSNPGCAGCAAGQVGQNGPGEVTISSGNRNFPGKQGLGDVYLASPEIAAASAVAGFITSPDMIPTGHIEQEPIIPPPAPKSRPAKSQKDAKPVEFTGRAWFIPQDDIDTDMIYHNRHLAITEISEMGKYALGNLDGYKSFSARAEKGDIIIAGKNFGSGSSRQQAVDCFISLGLACIVAESFGSIYERNAINAAFPVLVSDALKDLELADGDRITLNLESGKITNIRNNKTVQAIPFSEIQMEIYQNGGLF
jgi:3-isopropylmalate dehydratase small subunit